jgi:hypothetical protein
METLISTPCSDCQLDCGLIDDLVFIWNNTSEPAANDPDFVQLVNTLVATLSQLVEAQQITTPDDLGIALAALFDLCVSLEYAKLVTDIDWVYCPASQQHGNPVLLYPYVKACPRCVALGQVARAESHKPRSDTIGRIAAKTLGVLLSALSQQTGNTWQVRQLTRQVFDADMLLFTSETLALCEVKASPLVAFPLIAPLERELQQRGREDEQQRVARHRKTDLPLAKAGEISLYLPHVSRQYELGNPTSADYPIRSFHVRYAHDMRAVLDVIKAWQQLYEGYERRWDQDGDTRLRSLTFGCGGRVDDSKNSPGIDRTDDIKKGIYQMLKLGEHFAAQCRKGAIKVVLLANVHAVRHHSDYLSGLEDMIWTHEQLLVMADDPGWRKVRVDDLVKLYDAAITFTKPHFRDLHLSADFGLDVLLARLGGSAHDKD